MRTNLKIWEIKNNFKSNWVAEQLEVTPSYYSQMKQGNKNPSMKLLKKFEVVFGTTEGADNIYELFKNT